MLHGIADAVLVDGRWCGLLDVSPLGRLGVDLHGIGPWATLYQFARNYLQIARTYIGASLLETIYAFLEIRDIRWPEEVVRWLIKVQVVHARTIEALIAKGDALCSARF